MLASKIPLIGSIFKEVQDEQRYTGNFDEVAEPLTNGNVCTANDVTVTLSEVYCDTQALYVSVMLESAKPFSEELKKGTEQDTGEGIVHEFYLANSQEYDFLKTPAEYEIDNEDPDHFQWTPVACVVNLRTTPRLSALSAWTLIFIRWLWKQKSRNLPLETDG